MIYSFAPIVNQDSQIIILGSMPSVRSLVLKQYYGHKQNSFWPMLFDIFGEPFSDDYQVKQQLILKHHLAVWDVLHCCERDGSLDSQITNEVPNDFVSFFMQYPNIHTLIFNGGKAAQSFKKHFPQIYSNKIIHQMPSTSPAYTISKQEKQDKWRMVLL